MRKLPPLGSLRAFEAAARLMSFRKAATELGVTPTAISHQIRLLEEVCGQLLFRRRPRPLVLTGVGERLFPVICSGFDAFAAAIASASAGVGQRPLRVRAQMHLPADGWFRACRSGANSIRTFHWRSSGQTPFWTCKPVTPTLRSAMRAGCRGTFPRRKFSGRILSGMQPGSAGRRTPTDRARRRSAAIPAHPFQLDEPRPGSADLAAMAGDRTLDRSQHPQCQPAMGLEFPRRAARD